LEDSRIVARIADITTLDVDAIVNAANSSLAPGGGVCGAIHRAAGPELARACARLGHCATGDACLTPGFLLPARYVIHAVGPVWQGGHNGEAALLASAYQRSLEIAADASLQSMAFPAISTGIYAYPLDLATHIAVETVRTFLQRNTTIRQIIFACFNDAALAAYIANGVAGDRGGGRP